MLFLIHFLSLFFQVYTLLLFAWILSSWIPESREYRIVRWIGTVTEPYLYIFRQIIPPLGMVDISPIVAFLALAFLQNIVIKALILIAVR